MKKVLMITTEFPPDTSCGRYRPLKFAKFLPLFGWKPVILTRSATYIWDKDWSLMEEVPKDSVVYRAFYPDFIQILASLFSKNKKRESDPAEVMPQRVSVGKRNFKKIVLKIIKGYEALLNKYILIPDLYILWIPFAVYKSLIICRKEKLDIIFTTIPAFSLAIVGYILKLITKKPWVIDYRDLWSYGPWHADVVSFRKKIEKYIEKKMIAKADAIVVVSQPMIKYLKQLNPTIIDDKFIVISNGFDPEDLIIQNSNDQIIRNNKLTITYTGMIHKESSPSFFLKALGSLLYERQELHDKITVQFIGKIGNDQVGEIKNIIEKFKLERIVQFIDYMTHKEVLRYQKDADVLLLLVDPCRGSDSILTGKVFEYLFSGRIILALVSDGVARDLITTTKTGIAVAYEDIDGIKNALWDLYLKWEKNSLTIKPNWDVIKQFDRKVLTRSLAQIFSSVVSRKNSTFKMSS